MISKSIMTVCLEDCRKPEDVDHLFQMIEQCKSAIHAAGCRTLSFTYSNKLDKCHNPRGTIGSFEFEIASPDDEERELECKHSVFEDLGVSRVITEIVCKRKPKT